MVGNMGEDGAAAGGQIRFDDGAAYERYMGVWSQRAGEGFLRWLAPGAGLRWLDVGCGNGAFTELLAAQCAPAAIEGIDPAEAQIAYARSRPVGRLARFSRGDAMALPFGAASFDVAVMPLVIFFVPEPARGVAEMARVVRPGGLVAAYSRTIRRLSLSSRTVTTIAGSGDWSETEPRDGVGKSAVFNDIQQICMSSEGFIFSVEWNDGGRVRKISPDGTVKTIYQGKKE